MNQILFILPVILLLGFAGEPTETKLITGLTKGLKNSLKVTVDDLTGQTPKHEVGISFIPELRTCLMENGFEIDSFTLMLNILLQTLVDVNMVPYDPTGSCIHTPSLDRQYVRIGDWYTVAVSLGCDKILCIMPSSIVDTNLCVTTEQAPLIYRQVVVLIMYYLDQLRSECYIKEPALLSLQLFETLGIHKK